MRHTLHVEQHIFWSFENLSSSHIRGQFDIDTGHLESSVGIKLTLKPTLRRGQHCIIAFGELHSNVWDLQEEGPKRERLSALSVCGER